MNEDLSFSSRILSPNKMKIYVFLLSTMVLASSVIMLSVQNSFAQTADIVITGQGIGKKYGDFSVQNVRVSEKQHYKVVTIDVHVKVKNSELQDWFVFSPIQTNLVNLKGKSYPPDPSECKIPTMYQVSGKKGPDFTYSLCFSVEKDINEFKVTYRSDKLYQIGKIDLTQKQVKEKKDVKSEKNDLVGNIVSKIGKIVEPIKDNLKQDNKKQTEKVVKKTSQKESKKIEAKKPKVTVYDNCKSFIRIDLKYIETTCYKESPYGMTFASVDKKFKFKLPAKLEQGFPNTRALFNQVTKVYQHDVNEFEIGLFDQVGEKKYQTKLWELP